MPETPPGPIDIRAIEPERLALLLSNSLRKKVTESDVRLVIEEGRLADADGKVDLIKYAAFLAMEVRHGN
jgi:hypothetical protein